MAPITSLKITPETYAVYLAIPGVLHHPLITVNRTHIVFDPSLRNGVGYFEERDFHEKYKFITSPSPLKPTEIERINPTLEI